VLPLKPNGNGNGDEAPDEVQAHRSRFFVRR
jgi:hypothetical protein